MEEATCLKCRLSDNKSPYKRSGAAVIDGVRKKGDSCGGVVTCVVRHCPTGLGSPVFDKLEAELAKAIMSLPATKVWSLAASIGPTHLVMSTTMTWVRRILPMNEGHAVFCLWACTYGPGCLLGHAGCLHLIEL